ncbi:response regulator [Burkholderia sp. Bp8963]|uniref:PAS domain-containing hybrid sensor histidine kinase/response regulator n=1 Tax=Burkholderia sp. Bp8963 TaxID=2184547 RepID=UPI000F59806D|nr:PAS domain-containing hybrid sensor histidine kinase/response regulator [Burkholderia sp. Bp8963]RQS76855.1 response regulator [Burkholderia sp. Bp8963]
MRILVRKLLTQGAWIVLAVALASALQAWAVHVTGVHVPFVSLPFYAGIAAAAWLTSFSGGLAATVVSAAVICAVWLRDATLLALLAQGGRFLAIGLVECMLVTTVKPLFSTGRDPEDDGGDASAADPDAHPAHRKPGAGAQPGGDGGDDALLRRVVDASPDAIIGIDAAHRITSWNPAAERIFGAESAAVLGRDVTTLIADRWLRRHPVPASLSDQRVAVGPLDVLCMRRDGSRFRATFAASPIGDGHGGCAGLSMTLRDAHERRRHERRSMRSLRGARDARAQADTSNRLKDELLATVSHELRTPLNVIYGWVEVLRSANGQALERQAIDAIDRSARSLSHMVADLLDASSLATGKLRLERVPIDLVRIAREATRELDATARAAGLTLVTECALPACVISADGERVRQVLSNLLSNAIKFTPAGGRVVVSLTRSDDRVQLSVADTGQGIAPEFLPYVFDAFRRFEGGPTSPKRGLGLGLSIVRHIAQLHGGNVSAASEGTGRGTTVTVTLPLGWEPAGLSTWPVYPEGGAAVVALDGQRVLVVDDDATSRASLAAALETLGAQVATAVSGRDALDAVERRAPTVVLSDLAMPDGDGFWLLEHLRHRHARGGRLPVVAVTAHAGKADRNRVMAAGFDGYLCKPVDLPTLASVIVDVAPAATGDVHTPGR